MTIQSILNRQQRRAAIIASIKSGAFQKQEQIREAAKQTAKAGKDLGVTFASFPRIKLPWPQLSTSTLLTILKKTAFCIPTNIQGLQATLSCLRLTWYGAVATDGTIACYVSTPLPLQHPILIPSDALSTLQKMLRQLPGGVRINVVKSSIYFHCGDTTFGVESPYRPYPNLSKIVGCPDFDDLTNAEYLDFLLVGEVPAMKSDTAKAGRFGVPLTRERKNK